MYTSFYKLRGRPFQLTPDYRYFFESQPHKKAMSYLTYGLGQREGFVVITGDVGTGKTILVDYLFSKLEGERFVTGKVLTTQVEADNLLRMVAGAFGIPYEGHDKATLLSNVESFLVNSHRSNIRPLLVIDEVQNLSSGSLEELRMLSNYQLRELPLLQTFLVGQTQFRRTMASQTLEQLRQRVIATYHLRPLDAEETRKYIEHRLRHVGWQDDPSLTDRAFRIIYEQTGGVPRKINLLCDRLLLFGFLEERHKIDSAVVNEVIIDMQKEGLHGTVASPAARKESATEAPSPDSAPVPASESEGRSPTAADLDKLVERIAALERRVKAE